MKILDKGLDTGEKLFAVTFENDNFIGHIGCFDPEEGGITTYNCDPDDEISTTEIIQNIFVLKKGLSVKK